MKSKEWRIIESLIDFGGKEEQVSFFVDFP